MKSSKYGRTCWSYQLRKFAIDRSPEESTATAPDLRSAVAAFLLGFPHGNPDYSKKFCATLAAQNPMRHFISSFRRGIAAFMSLSILVSAIAMAAYLCPRIAIEPAPEMMMAMDMPCAGMDLEKPVHCASDQSASQFALEHLASTPLLAPPAIIFVQQIAALRFNSPILASATASHTVGADPPYLRTQRLRI